MADAVETTETKTPEALGTEAEQNQQTETVDKAQYEALLKEAEELRKEKQQVEMEKNLQRNKAKEEERKRAEEGKDFDKLFQIMKEENDDLKTKFESATTKTVTEAARKEALDRLPENIKEAAQALLNKAASPEQVAEKVAEIELMAEQLGVEIKPKSTVKPLNPNPNQAKLPEKKKELADWKQELHTRALKEAGIAPK